jgi:hypothetical protein
MGIVLKLLRRRGKLSQVNAVHLLRITSAKPLMDCFECLLKYNTADMPMSRGALLFFNKYSDEFQLKTGDIHKLI